MLETRVQQFTTQHIATVLVTDPPYGKSGNMVEWPEVLQQRILAYNDVLRRYALDHPAVGLIDLATRVCPEGTPCDDLTPDGSRYRPSDGIHFDGQPASVLADWIARQLEAFTSKLFNTV